MRAFAIDEKGDIIIGKSGGNSISPSGNQIQMIEGNALTAQKCVIVLGTNIGEWFWNVNLGINYDFVIGKGITDDMLQSQMSAGIHQVDPNMYISDFEVTRNKTKRTAYLSFVIENDEGKIAKIETAYGVESGAGTLAEANAKITVYENALARLENRLANSRA